MCLINKREKQIGKAERLSLNARFKYCVFIYLPLTLFILGIVAEASYSQNAISKDKSSHITEEVISESHVVDGITTFVEQTVWSVSNASASFSKTVESFIIKDEAGKKLYVKSYEVRSREGENGFQEEFVVSSGKIKTPEKEALILNYSNYPSAPGSGHQMQFFVWRGDELKPLSPPFNIYGHFDGLTLEPEDGTTELERDEIILNTKHTAYHFYLKIPVKIDFGDDVANDPYDLPLAQDVASGLDIMQVEVMPREKRKSYMSEKPQQVTLYSSPLGNKATTVTVNKESMIKVGPAYGKASIRKWDSDHSDPTVNVTDRVKRLKVTIDGRSGFVEEKDYMKLGLPAFG